MFKLILSPDQPGVDLEKLAKDTMKQVEIDLARKLEWVAVVHHNTDHAHVHIALRGVDKAGEQYAMVPEYISSGIRRIAVNLCTQQLGPRFTQAIAQEPSLGQRIYARMAPKQVASRGITPSAQSHQLNATGSRI